MEESNHPEVVLLGAGNLANHLGIALFNAGIKVRQVVNRTQARGELLAKKLHASFATGPADMDMNADVLHSGGQRSRGTPSGCRFEDTG